jgi:hypothetical protein
MGKFSISACVPLVFATLSFACILSVCLGGISAGSKGLYFMKVCSYSLIQFGTLLKNIFFQADTSKLSIHPTLTNSPFLNGIASTLGVADSYSVALWSYCATSNQTGSSNVNCSKPTTDFWFNPIQAWHLNNTVLMNTFPTTLTKVLRIYHNCSKAMVSLYIAAVSCTFVASIVGGFAVFSEVGSGRSFLVTSISAFLLLAASSLATSVYVPLAATFDSVLRSYSIGVSLGRDMFALTWSAALLSLMAALFWLLRWLFCCGKRR